MAINYEGPASFRGKKLPLQEHKENANGWEIEKELLDHNIHFIKVLVK